MLFVLKYRVASRVWLLSCDVVAMKKSRHYSIDWVVQVDETPPTLDGRRKGEEGGGEERGEGEEGEEEVNCLYLGEVLSIFFIGGSLNQEKIVPSFLLSSISPLWSLFFSLFLFLSPFFPSIRMISMFESRDISRVQPLQVSHYIDSVPYPLSPYSPSSFVISLPSLSLVLLNVHSEFNRKRE